MNSGQTQNSALIACKRLAGGSNFSPMSAYGFKEWKLVCDAMERGEQSLILRKGGISEGKHGFQWLHREFFLFPTYFHEQAGRLQLSWEPDSGEVPTKERDRVEIRQFAEIAFTAEISDLVQAQSLADFHVWAPEVIEERFGCGENNGISLAVMRVFRLNAPWILENRASFGGCRSWLGLPEDEGRPEIGEPVLSDAEFGEILGSVKARLGSS